MFDQWAIRERINNSFAVLILNWRVTIIKKIKKYSEKTKNTSLGRGKQEVKEAFIAMLDKLFDILNCKCETKLRSEFVCRWNSIRICVHLISCTGGVDCKHEVHTFCCCYKNMKIPAKELMLINKHRSISIVPLYKS